MTARDWDLDESFRPIYIGTVVALTFGVASFYVVSAFVTPPLAAFYLSMLVALVVVGSIIWPLAKRQSRRLTATHKGYNQQPAERPFFWFGSAEYNRYRIDEGVMQGMRRGLDPHADKLDKLEREQREGACEVCHEDVYGMPSPMGDEFYVVEDRRVYRVFGIPVREKICGWKTYCSQHKPNSFI